MGAGGLVGAEEGVVLPAPGQRLCSNAMPHDPVTGYVFGVGPMSVAPTRKFRAPSSGVHILGVAPVHAPSLGSSCLWTVSIKYSSSKIDRFQVARWHMHH